MRADEHSKRHKRNMILKALSSSPPDVATLRQLAISRGGLLDDSLRKRAWPCLLDIDVQSIPAKPGQTLCSSIIFSVFFPGWHLAFIVHFFLLVTDQMLCYAASVRSLSV